MPKNDQISEGGEKETVTPRHKGWPYILYIVASFSLFLAVL